MVISVVLLIIISRCGDRWLSGLRVFSVFVFFVFWCVIVFWFIVGIFIVLSVLVIVIELVVVGILNFLIDYVV